MRILHVGNFGSRAKGAYLHSVAPKLSRGMVRLGHHVIDFSDRDIARAATPFGARKLGIGAVNRALTDAVRDSGPDLLLLGHADTIRAATIAAIRVTNPRLRVVQWNVDPLFEPDNVARLLSKTPVVDATLVSTAGAALRLLQTSSARPGMRVGFLPNPVDFSVESSNAHENPNPAHDLFYACGHPNRPRRALFGTEWDIEDFFRTLRARLPNMRALLPGLFGAPHLAGAPYQAALATCAMGVNASRRNDQFLYSSDRLAHMIGNGQAILIDRATGYDALFSDSEMLFFSSMDDLAGHIKRMIADPAARMALASAGRARYHALFNETLVAGYVLGVAFGTHDAARYAWPTLLAPKPLA